MLQSEKSIRRPRFYGVGPVWPCDGGVSPARSRRLLGCYARVNMPILDDRRGAEVTQRKCGTCRHFEEGGIAGSGWCRHPLRQDLQHMVLVRKSELACRNGWEQDLWEPRRSETDRHTPDKDGAGPVSRPTLAPLDEEPGRTDTVAKITMAPLDRSERRAVPAPRGIDRAPSVDTRRGSAASPRTVPSGPLRSTLPESDPAPDLTRRETTLPRSTSTTSTTSEPPLGRPISRTPRLNTPRLTPDDSWANPSRWGAAAETDGLRPTPPRRRPVAPRASSTPGTAPIPRSSDVGPPTRRSITTPPEPPQASTHGESWVQSRSGSTEPFELVPPAGTVPTNESQVELPPAEPMAPDVAGPDVAGDDVEGLAGTAAAELPRCCRTCRDFRPTEGGERGWCHNRYAFEHSRMVQADELACQSTIGHWWLPTDDWWLQKADISHHGRPTPIVDEYLHRLLAERAAARRREAR